MAHCDLPFISYATRDRLFGLCWRTDVSTLRLAASTFIPGEYVNKIKIFQPMVGHSGITCSLEIDHPYPPTKIMWSPSSLNVPTEYLATTADYLRLWTVNETAIEQKMTIADRKQDTTPPLTNFDWSDAEPNLIITSSVDMSCTLWDLNRPTSARHKIIAHDQEVYDVAFSNLPYMFGSVGGDGTLRLFDLRDLDSSVIVYESPDHRPLVRVAFNKRDDRYLATFWNGGSTICVIDRRHTSYPVVQLTHHDAAVNSFSWSPHSRYELCSAGEDRCLRVYDICASVTIGQENGKGLENSHWNSNLLLKSDEPINQVSWSPTEPSCIGLVDEKALHVIQV